MDQAGFFILVFLASAFAGSFLNVVIYRGPALWGLVDTNDQPRGNLISPRSYCPHCRTPIPYWRLMPLISFAILRGRCPDCGGRISSRYPLVELAAALHGVSAAITFGATPAALFAALFGWILLALAVIDFETGYLPDWLTGALALGGLAANAFSIFVPPVDALIGALAGGLAFWTIGALWRRWRGIDALGLGDAKLLAALGLWMGWEALPLIVLVGSVASILVVVLAPLARGEKINATDAVPFGPGLAFGGYAVFLAIQLAI